MQFHLLFLYRIILMLVNCFSATDSSLTNPHGLYSYRPYPLNDVKMFKTEVERRVVLLHCFVHFIILYILRFSRQKSMK